MHKLGGRRRGMRQRSGDDDELAELEQRLNSANLPEHAHKVAQKELTVSQCPTDFHISNGCHGDSVFVGCPSSFLNMQCHVTMWRRWWISRGPITPLTTLTSPRPELTWTEITMV